MQFLVVLIFGYLMNYGNGFRYKYSKSNDNIELIPGKIGPKGQKGQRGKPGYVLVLYTTKTLYFYFVNN